MNPCSSHIIRLAAAMAFFLAAVSAFAQSTDDGLTNALKQIATDAGQAVDVRIEAVKTLAALKVQDGELYRSLVADRQQANDLRGAAIAALGALDSIGDSVKTTLLSIVSDKTDAKVVRSRAVSLIGRIGIDVIGARETLRTILNDVSDAHEVRSCVVAMLAARDSTNAETPMLLSVLNNGSDDWRVRVAVLNALNGRSDAAFVAAIKRLIEDTAVPAEKDTAPAINALNGPMGRLMLRLRAVDISPAYFDNAEILAAVRAAASNKADNAAVRNCAIKRLMAKAKQSDVEGTLIALAADRENSQNIRLTAISALYSSTSVTAANGLASILANSEEAVKIRMAAAAALSNHLPSKKRPFMLLPYEPWAYPAPATGALVSIIANRSQDAGLRRGVLIATQHSEVAEILAALRIVAQDKAEDDGVRLLALAGLGVDQGSVEVLGEVASDESESTKIRAAAAKAADSASGQAE